jgi:hypothetical protein
MKLGNLNLSAAFLGNTEIEKILLGADVVYEKVVGPPNWFYVEDLSGVDNTLSIKKCGASGYSGEYAPTLTIEKSSDGQTWETMGTTGTTAITATIPANGKLFLRCITNKWADSYLYWNRISASENHAIGGNIMSLLQGSGFPDGSWNFTSDRVFQNLFNGNIKLINASNLVMPTTTLVRECYYGMFEGCTSLTAAPTLPATTLANQCYQRMFRGCTSLTDVPSELPATYLADECYSNMFYGCTSLTAAPKLPSRGLSYYCYNWMFGGCTNLKYIKAMFITSPSKTYTQNWVNGVAAIGTFVKNTQATWSVTGANGVPSGWTVQTASE